MEGQWKKNFFLIWCGQAVSHFSSDILQFAIVWHLTKTTGSPLVLSYAMLVGFLPRALLGPFIGVFIDRYNRKRIMVLSDLFIAFASLFLVFASFFNPVIPTGLIYLVLFLRSVGTAFHEPTLHAVTPQIVPKEELVRCGGYSQTLQSVSQIFSPVLAAVIFSVWSLNRIILLDVAGALIAVTTLSFAKIPSMPKTTKPLKLSSVVEEAKEGFALLRSKGGLLGLVLVTSLYSIAMMPISALFPIMCMDYFGKGTSMGFFQRLMEYFGGQTSYAGFVEMIFAIGLLIGSLILSVTGGTKNKMHSIYVSFLIMMASLFLTGSLTPEQFGTFVIAAFFMGLSGPFLWGIFHALLQQSFPPESLGKVMSLSNGIRVLASPIGMTISGFFSEYYGAKQWFVVAGFLILIALVIALAVPSIRNCDSLAYEKE